MEEFTIQPTVLVRRLPDRIDVVSAGEGETEGLIVFRGAKGARRYQEYTNKHTAAEGYELLGMDQEGIAALLDFEKIPYVHMPERWIGGNGGVDTFTAENFVRLLAVAREEEG